MNLLKDLSILTTIPEKSFAKIAKKATYCICENVEESMLQNEQVTGLDIGIGTLYIKVVEDNIKYKFEPNEFLAESLKDTVVNKKCLLEDLLEEALAKKFIEVYKDLC